VRAKYRFALGGYVIMPEHVHLLASESAAVTPSNIVQVFKQRVSLILRGKKRVSKEQLALCFLKQLAEPQRFWQRRCSNFNVYSRKQLLEKLDYTHAKPVEEGLVRDARDWPWSSWSNYELGNGLLKIDVR